MRRLDQGGGLTDVQSSGASCKTFSSGGGDVASAKPRVRDSCRRLAHLHRVQPPQCHGGILHDIQFWGRGRVVGTGLRRDAGGHLELRRAVLRPQRPGYGQHHHPRWLQEQVVTGFLSLRPMV
ncbi:hypothetical protein VPH35_024529 [Triticum aestivum]